MIMIDWLIDRFRCSVKLTVIAEMETGLRFTGHRVSDFGRVGSGHSLVSVSDPVFDPVLTFNMRIYGGVISTE